MSGKILSAIEKIALNAATFSGEQIVPTLINFFYGNNGTGKSTIARAIAGNNGLTWQQGKSATNYNVLVYNQEFVAENFQDYGSLKGVFTIGKLNIEIQNQIAEKGRQKSELDKQHGERITEKERKESAKNTLLGSFQDSCWDKAKSIREGFEATQVGFKRKAQFADRVMQIASPTQHDLEALKALYGTAFGADAQEYDEFQPLGNVTRLKGSSVSELLSKAIVSSGDSPFANFIKALNATDWVRQGHDNYPNTDGKCPYCQQKLPENFEDDIAACFDAQYQQDRDALKEFQADYESDMRGFIDTLKANLTDVFPKLDLKEYNDKLALFEKTIEINIQRITDKVKEPSISVTLENVKPLREEINAIIAGFNALIKANNDIIAAKTQKQAECKTKVWEYIAHLLRNDVSAYRTSLNNLNTEITTLNQQINSDRQALQAIDVDIAALNKNTISTKPTIDGINNLLRDSGFQGFSLREKRGHENVYEVIRSDGRVAVNLSEGERNFIAFLYFYFLVRGSHNENDAGKDRIVVIDDPVSSLDSSVLFIVSTLVREMLEVCNNNIRYSGEDYIKQIFVLTHNVYFHKEITYNQASQYECVSFFVVNKTSNISTVKLCERRNLLKPTEMENYNPVQNSYAALWSEYKELKSPLTVLNVIRRILEYYFIQLCGYDGMDIRKRILEENKDDFIVTAEDGQTDYTKYHLASAMLSYINANALSLTDGLHYVDDSTDIEQCKSVFKLVFETMQQGQHYSMMMGDE